MRIVSQNRTASLMFESHDLYVSEETIVTGDGIFLGRYESPERALEVFMDIHNAYSPITTVLKNISRYDGDAIETMCKRLKNTTVVAIQVSGESTGIDYFENVVYLMPEE